MKALVTGITGQDGYYLSKLLLEKGYEVHGLIRRSSSFNTSRIEPLMSKYESQDKLKLYYSDLLDSSSITSLINLIEPDEVYNLAAQSHVAVSFKNPLYTSQTSTVGPVALLEVVKNSEKKIKYYQASSSEMYGGIDTNILNEQSKFIPKSPYAVGKVFAHEMTKVYRESYDMFAVNGILFNHESPHRGETFVTRKITRGLSRINYGLDDCLYMGNLDSLRDWGHAKDYVDIQWRILQQKEPDDYVVATGRQESVRTFIELSAKKLGWGGILWEGSGLNEVGRRLDTKKIVIKIDEKYFRPCEVNSLIGDSSKANKKLGWSPTMNLEQLVEDMISHDKKIAQKESLLMEKGYDLKI